MSKVKVLSQWVSEWQGHLLSCQVTAKNILKGEFSKDNFSFAKVYFALQVRTSMQQLGKIAISVLSIDRLELKFWFIKKTKMKTFQRKPSWPWQLHMSTRQMGRSIHKSTCLRRWSIITDHKDESDPPASGHPNQPDHKKYKRKRKYKHFSDKKPVGLEDEKTSLASRASNLFHLGLLASTTNFEILIFFYISDFFYVWETLTVLAMFYFTLIFVMKQIQIPKDEN